MLSHGLRLLIFCDVLVVAPIGVAGCRIIREALERIQPGSPIVIRPGADYESLALIKPVDLIGDDPLEEIVIISDAGACISMPTTNGRVAGVTLQKTGAKEGYGVDIGQGRLILENCNISSQSLGCVSVHGWETSPLIRNCKIHDGKRGGLFFYESAQGIVEACDIFANAGLGVAVTDQRTSPITRNCKFRHEKS